MSVYLFIYSAYELHGIFVGHLFDETSIMSLLTKFLFTTRW